VWPRSSISSFGEGSAKGVPATGAEVLLDPAAHEDAGV
jgi:hypothetical protein